LIKTMLILFKELLADGTDQPILIPSEQVAFIRPLSPHEKIYVENLRTGRYEEFLKFEGTHQASIMADREDCVAAREFESAISNGTNIVHVDCQSILQTNDGRRYCIRKAVDDLASHARTVIELSSMSAPPFRRDWAQVAAERRNRPRGTPEPSP
jgi:hypothetical protein